MPTPEQPHNPDHPSPETTLMHMIHGTRITQLIRVAATLGIADLLRDGPKSSDELAQAVGAHPRTLYRALRALASLGIFAENDEGRFQLTPLAEPLRRGVPGSLGDYAILEGEPWYCHPDSELLYSVRTGKPAFDYVHGMGLFAYLHQHAEAAACFNAAQTSFSGHELAAVVTAYDFAAFPTIVDVGGGHGALLAEILQAYPHPRSILREAFPEADGLHEAAQIISSTTIDKIRSAGFDVISNPTKKLPNYYRLIHPDGVAGFNDENLARLSAVFTETSGHAL